MKLHRVLFAFFVLGLSGRLLAAPTINTQPVSAVIVIGTNASFNVAATTSGGTLTYQWQGSLDNGVTWGNIGNGPPFANVTTATLAVNAPAAQYSGAKVRCVVTDTNGSTPTDGTASLNITTTAPLLILAQPTNKSAFQSDVATTDFKVLATGTGLTYQWQISTFVTSSYGAFTNLTNSAPYSGVTTNVLSITDPYGNLGGATVSNPNHYRCLVTNGGSYSITTRFAQLNIYTTPANTASVTTEVNGSPASTIVSNDPSAITVQVSGIVSGTAVRIDRYLDLNGNGVIDPGEPLVQGFMVVDGNGAGANNTFGGVTDPDIPKDDDLTADGTVNASFTLTNAADLSKGAGAYIFRVSSPAGLFKTVDSSVFTVTQPTLAHTVSGTVNVPYAQVALLVNSGNNGPTVVNETVSDGSGNFTLQAAPGMYNVLALALGYVTSFNTSPSADTTSADVTGLTLNLVPADYINSVTLQDQVSGNPLRGVQVVFQSNSSNNIAIGSTDANGVVNGGAVAEPDWTIDMSSQSLGTLAYLRPQSDNGIPLNTLVYVQPLRQANAMIYGTLTDNTTAPLANVNVNASDQNNQYEADTTTDATGHYYLPVYGSGGGWNVQVDNSDPIFASGHNPAYIAPSGQGFSPLNSGTATVANFVANVATAFLSGTVRNADNGNSPINNAQMNLLSVVGQNVNFAGSVTTDNNNDGSFSFGVTAGSWQIQMDSNYAASNNLVAPLLSYPGVTDGGNVPGISYAVKNGTGTISGSVIDFSGAGISGANVSATAVIGPVTYVANAQTSSGGGYSFPVIDGTWTINGFANNGLFYPTHNNVSVSGSVSGQVFSPSVFTTNPGNHSVNAGNSTNFSVGTNVPGSPSYQWQVCTDGGGVNFNDIAVGAPYSGTTTNNLGISSATVSLNSFEYRLKVTFTYNSVQYTRYSNFGTLTVTGSAPSITGQPTSQTIQAMNGANFSVSATGSPNTFTFQWKISTDGGSTFTNLVDGGHYTGSTVTNLSVSNTDTTMSGYKFECVVSNGVAPDATTNVVTLTVNAISQSINNFSDSTVSLNSPTTLNASATSGLAVTYAEVSTTGGATYTLTGTNNNTLTITSPGSVTIQASQAGNGFYAPASLNAKFTVNLLNQTISFTGPSNQAFSTTPISLSATGGGSGNPVTFSLDSGLATLSGTNNSTLTLTGTGTVTVRASQAGNSSYNAATDVVQSFNVSKANQTISFTGPPDQAFSATPITLSASGGGSGNPVTFSLDSGPATLSGTNNSTLTLTGAGTVMVRASQAGNSNYNAATDVVQSFNVGANFNSWAQSKFTADELLNHPELSGSTAVYGQDGLPNLVKYALGLEPKQNITTGLPTVTNDGTNWIYTYKRPDGTVITDVTYTVEVSTDLVTWTSTGVTLSLMSNSSGIDTWQGTYPVASAAKLFFRLNVTQP